STSVKRRRRDDKMPRYQTTEMHYEWSFERLCRYAARPAVATERLSKLADGRLLYPLKRPSRDGTTAVIFEPQDFLAKLAALVPAPRVHLVRFHGILGPAAALRALIIPTGSNKAESTPAQGNPVISSEC